MNPSRLQTCPSRDGLAALNLNLKLRVYFVSKVKYIPGTISSPRKEAFAALPLGWPRSRTTAAESNPTQFVTTLPRGEPTTLVDQ